MSAPDQEPIPDRSRERELALVLAAKARPGPDRDRLVRAYLPLIGSIARTYAGTGNIERRELMQDGIVGLLRALQRFDPELGVSLWAYASWWVRQAMQQLVSEMARPIVLSDRALRQLARIRAAERRFAQEHGREPTLRELADSTGFTLEHVESLACAARRPRALEERVGEQADDGVGLGERLADARAEDEYELVPTRIACTQLPILLGVLDDRERAIVRKRFGLDGEARTLRELAESLGVSAERVRQIEEGALEKCRTAASAHARHG
jgi:RNA polymerase sigma factor (sigma-70 family)